MGFVMESDESGHSKDEFLEIAEILCVPKEKQSYFADKVLELSALNREYGGFGDYLPALKRVFSVEPLERASMDLKKGIDLLREHELVLNRAISIDFRRTLVELLDHPKAHALLPDCKFASLDSYLREPESLADRLENMKTADGKSYEAPAENLIALLDLLQKHLSQDLQRREQNAGGRPPKRWLRERSIQGLLVLHGEMFEEPATPTPDGKFSAMCHLLFESFGESTDGLDEAIKRFLRKRRSETS